MGGYALINSGILEYASDDIPFKNEIANLLIYYQLRNFLQNETLSDHHNEIKREFVFYSSTKGVIKISYESIAPHISNSDYSESSKALMSVIGETHYKSY